MGLLQRMFGRAGAAPAPSASPASRSSGSSAAATARPPSTRGGANSAQSVRRELLRVSVRDTLMHNGIPVDWIRVDPLTMSSPGREPGLHVRMTVLHWDPRLMIHAIALQQNLNKRIQALDPMAEQWLMGMSWQFALKDDTACPPLPHPGSWTSPPPDSPAGAAPAPTGGSADVISGPTRIAVQQRSSEARSELERMLSERDADFDQRGGKGGGSFEKTQPMRL